MAASACRGVPRVRTFQDVALRDGDPLETDHAGDRGGERRGRRDVTDVADLQGPAQRVPVEGGAKGPLGRPGGTREADEEPVGVDRRRETARGEPGPGGLDDRRLGAEAGGELLGRQVLPGGGAGPVRHRRDELAQAHRVAAVEGHLTVDGRPRIDRPDQRGAHRDGDARIDQGCQRALRQRRDLGRGAGGAGRRKAPARDRQGPGPQGGDARPPDGCPPAPPSRGGSPPPGRPPRSSSGHDSISPHRSWGPRWRGTSRCSQGPRSSKAGDQGPRPPGRNSCCADAGRDAPGRSAYAVVQRGERQKWGGRDEP